MQCKMTWESDDWFSSSWITKYSLTPRRSRQVQEVTEVLRQKLTANKKRKIQVWWDRQNYPGKKQISSSCTVQVSLLISSCVLFFSCSNWTRTRLPYPLLKVIVIYPIPALFIIHLLIWNFILQTSCYRKSFEKCLLWPLRCLLKRNVILKYNCAADLAHWCLTE